MNVTVQCVRRNQIETHHQTIATDDQAVRRLVNYFEDEVGVVLSVEHEDGRTLFRSGFEAWEAMQ